MYAADTILARKEPLPEPNAKGKTDEERAGDPLAPYNRVRVIGPSPVQWSGGAPAEWQGGQATGVLIQPTPAFGPTVERPLGELQRDYTIEFEPELTIEAPTVRVINAHSHQAGETPEEVFRNGSQASIPKSKGIPEQMRGMQ